MRPSGAFKIITGHPIVAGSGRLELANVPAERDGGISRAEAEVLTEPVGQRYRGGFITGQEGC